MINGALCVTRCGMPLMLLWSADNSSWRSMVNFVLHNPTCPSVCDIINSNTGAEALSQARFGEGIGNIWVDSVQCMGNERSLMNCTAIFSGITTCTHAQDAGVRCPPGIHIF